MKRGLKRMLSIIVCLVSLMCNFNCTPAFANDSNATFENYHLSKSISYIYDCSENNMISKRCAASISKVMELLINSNNDIYIDELLDSTLENISDIIFYENLYNTDGMTNYLIVDDLFDSWIVDSLISFQNLDGGSVLPRTTPATSSTQSSL